MSRVLKKSFFNRDSFLVAEELMGQKLCRQVGSSIWKYTISEVEVYDGYEDKASHAFNKKSYLGRSAVMFGDPGIWYIYLCYGMHWMLNIVTRERGYPAALLIRSCLEIQGPGRLTRNLNINQNYNAKNAHPSTALWIEENPSLNHIKIIKTPRIGIHSSGEYWSQKKFRYLIKNL